MSVLEHRQQASPALLTGPGIPYHTFMGVQWAGASFSVFFVLVRLVSRWLGPRRIFWDDVLAVFAASLMLITAALWQYAARDMYYVLNLQAGLVPLEADFEQRVKTQLKITLITEIFFYTCLFLVKCSFILFFKRLGSNVRGQAWLRWPAFALSLVCWAVSVGDMGFHCMINDLVYLTTYCVSPEFSEKMMNAVIANCVLDIVSDLAIMIIPFTLLWDVRIHLEKKLAFAGLFSLTLITISAAIARTIQTKVTEKANGLQDPSHVWMWGTIQASVAVIVVCLSAFPQLFAASTRRVKPQWTPTETYYQRLRSRIARRHARSTDPLYDVSAITFNDRGQKTLVEATSFESQQPVLGPEKGRTAAECSTIPARGQSPTLPDQILRQVEYRINVSGQPVTQQRG